MAFIERIRDHHYSTKFVQKRAESQDEKMGEIHTRTTSNWTTLEIVGKTNIHDNLRYSNKHKLK